MEQQAHLDPAERGTAGAGAWCGPTAPRAREDSGLRAREGNHISTSHEFISRSQMPQKCFGNCCRAERRGEGGRNVLDLAGESTAASVQGLGRSRVQGLSAAKDPNVLHGPCRRKQLMGVHSQVSRQCGKPGLSRQLRGAGSSGP